LRKKNLERNRKGRRGDRPVQLVKEGRQSEGNETKQWGEKKRGKGKAAKKKNQETRSFCRQMGQKTKRKSCWGQTARPSVEEKKRKWGGPVESTLGGKTRREYHNWWENALRGRSDVCHKGERGEMRSRGKRKKEKK